MDTLLALKVAARFAAKRPMKPEKLRELMLKLRKGAGTGLKVGAVMPVFEALGGWKFDEFLFPQPTIDYRPDNKGQFSHDRRDVVEAEWEKVKKDQVDRLPTDSQLSGSDLHKKVYMDVGPIQESDRGGFWFSLKTWQISSGVLITAPNGAKLPVSVHPDRFENEYFGTLAKWLKNDTPFFKQLNDALGMDSVEHEKEVRRLDQQRLHRESGRAMCSVCSGMFKLTPKSKKGKDKTMPGMVLHGYQRPGTGWIEGSCFGQDYPPYELSSEGTEAWLERMEAIRTTHQKGVTRLKSGEVSEISANDGKIVDGKYIPSTIYRKSEMAPREWERIFQRELRESEKILGEIEGECARLRKMITDWKYVPLS